MTTQFFTQCSTVEETKKLYRTLAMKHHPDHGGDTATMQEVNSQYHAKLKSLNGNTSKGEDGKDHTYKYNADLEQELIEKINATLKAGIVNGNVNLWLIGTWVWVEGDTKPIKEQLKQLGYQWHSKRVCWYYQNDGYKHRFNSKESFSGLAEKYGATRFTSQSENPIA